MSTDRKLRDAISLGSLLFFGHLGAAAADQITLGTWKIPPITHQRTVAQTPDGTTLTGGDFNLDTEDCPQAFLQAQGRRNWVHTQASFFATFSSLDPAYIVSSSLHDLDIDIETGEILSTGEVLLSWQAADSDELVMSRGAFIAVLDADGNLSRDVFLGPSPEGPPPDSKTCPVLCALGSPDPRPQNGGRCLATDGTGGFVAVGWHLGDACNPESSTDRELFVSRYTSKDLTKPDWQVITGTPGDDTCEAVTFGDAKEIFLTGRSETGDQDLLVVRLGKSGTVDRMVTLADPGDGSGESLTVTSEGVTVNGFINGPIEFAGKIVGDEDYHEISALFDSQLQQIAATTTDPPPSGDDVSPPPLPIKSSQPASAEDPPHSEGHLGVPTTFVLAAGESMAGGLRELEGSDNRYMRIQAVDHTIRLFVYFDPGVEPVFLDEISLELRTESCYTATVFLDRANSAEFDVIGQRGMCPTNEPVLRVEIPREASIALGYDSVNRNPDWQLRVGVILEFPEPIPPDPNSCILLSQSAQEASVDQVRVEVEY